MITDYITHDKVMIKNFIEHHDYAQGLPQAVVLEGDDYESNRFQGWYDEAKVRTHKRDSWKSIDGNTAKTAKEGKNLEVTVALMSRALSILKAAIPAEG